MSKGESVETDKKNDQSDSALKAKEKREKNGPPTKVVIRKLPPTMTQETFIDQVSPLPDHDYLYFVKGDLSLGQFAFSRAYIDFINQEDIFIFTEKFDGYVFVDQKGSEFPAMVEFAPFQKIPKRAARKRDSKCGTIENDSDYLRFLENKEKEAETEAPPSTTQEVLEEIEAKERELRANHGVLRTSTPLLDYLRQRKEEKIRVREEKKEERRRREADRRKIREEERRRPKDMPHQRDSRDAKDKYDKNRIEKVPKQLLTHKDKEIKSTEKDVELTKKLKEVLKINTTSEKQDQKKEGSSKDTLEKDFHRDREKDHYKDRNRDRDHRHEKEKDRDHHRHHDKDTQRGDREHHREKDYHHSDRDKDHRGERDKERDHRSEREKERIKRREEERARKLARKPDAVKSEKQETKSRETVKETKSYQSFREERQKQQEARASRAKQAEKSSSTGQDKPVTPSNEATKSEAPGKDEKHGDKAIGEEKPSNDKEKKEDSASSVSNKKEKESKTESGSRVKPERIRNKDRPSIQIYRPGMLKKRLPSSGDSAAGGRQGASASQDSASTSASSSPTPPISSKESREELSKSSSKKILSKPSSDKEKSDDDKSKDNSDPIPVKTMTFKRSLS